MLLFTGVGELWYNLSEIEPKAKIELRFTHTPNGCVRVITKVITLTARIT